MKIAELIAELQGLPPDAEVIIGMETVDGDGQQARFKTRTNERTLFRFAL